MKKNDNKDKKPAGMKCYTATPVGLTTFEFYPKSETIHLLKLYAENYKIIEVISNEYEPTTRFIAKKIGLGSRRTLDILKELRTAGVLNSKKDKNNVQYWSHTKYKGVVIRRLFTEICNIIEKPTYRAKPQEIINCLELIKRTDSQTRETGLKYLLKISTRKSISHDSQIMKTLTSIIKDASYDKFKDIIIECFMNFLPNPLKDKKKCELIEKLDGIKLEKDLQELNKEELNKIVKEFYPDQMIRALERYCFNEPISPVTIPLSLTLMRMLDEELAVKNMVRIVENPTYSFHYQYITLPANGLSTPMREKLYDGILKLASNHPDENVRIRANLTFSILIDTQ
jgi:hypothetical protein